MTSPAAPNLAPSTEHAKALALNLDASAYGTLAEIGAGQEVARWFLRVGGASGTVAQAISAYDKTVSDDTYGAGTRYVSRERLLAMLDHEYTQLTRRLIDARGKNTRFFVFADTVAARNFRGDNEQHGWLGVRFQASPGEVSSDILLHVNLRDPTNQQQQEALGTLGVNLIYAAFHHRASSTELLNGLFDRLSIERLEIDVIELTGPAFAHADSREWSIAALKNGMAHAIVFDSAGNVIEPSSALRKRPLIVERGQFGRVEAFHSDMIRAAQRQLKAEHAAAGATATYAPAAGATAANATTGATAAPSSGREKPREPAVVWEMTVRHASGAAPMTEAEILQRMQPLLPLGTVVVTDFPQTYRLVEYLRRYTPEAVRFVVGVASLAQLMESGYYETLPGTLLEGLGRFLASNVKVYAYPMPADAFRAALGDRAPGAPATGFVTADALQFQPPLNQLYAYLCESGWIVSLEA